MHNSTSTSNSLIPNPIETVKQAAFHLSDESLHINESRRQDVLSLCPTLMTSWLLFSLIQKVQYNISIFSVFHSSADLLNDSRITATEKSEVRFPCFDS